jgi:hypothetical protein
MRQNDIKFINILNRFWTTLQTFEDINFINKICFKEPPKDNTLPYLFHTNVKTITHNNNIFCTTPSQTFKFLTWDIHSNTCPFHFKLSNIPSQTNSLHHELLFLKNVSRIMCMKLWHIRWSCKWRIDGNSNILHNFFKNHLYGYNFIISKLETQWKLKICTFMNNSLSSIMNGHLLNIYIYIYYIYIWHRVKSTMTWVQLSAQM